MPNRFAIFKVRSDSAHAPYPIELRRVPTCIPCLRSIRCEARQFTRIRFRMKPSSDENLLNIGIVFQRKSNRLRAGFIVELLCAERHQRTRPIDALRNRRLFEHARRWRSQIGRGVGQPACASASGQRPAAWPGGCCTSLSGLGIVDVQIRAAAAQTPRTGGGCGCWSAR